LGNLIFSKYPKDYLPGDIVCWNLGGTITHFGIVVNKKSADNQRHLIVDNIDGDQVLEDYFLTIKLLVITGMGSSKKVKLANPCL
jgi:hypothetical protein